LQHVNTDAANDVIANAPAASYLLRRFSDDDGRRDQTTPSCTKPAMHYGVVHGLVLPVGCVGSGSGTSAELWLRGVNALLPPEVKKIVKI